MKENEVIFDLDFDEIEEELSIPLTENEVEKILEEQVKEYLKSDLSDHVKTLGLRREVEGNTEKIIAPHNHPKSDTDKYEYLNESEKEEYYIKYKFVIETIAKNYVCDLQRVYLEDLIDVGTIGFVKALNAYRLSMNVKFTTFCSVCIRNEIYDYLKKINNKTVKEYSYNTDDEDDMADIDKYESDFDMDEEIQKKMELDMIRLIIDELDQYFSEKDIFILKSYYEIDGFQKRTQSELGIMFNCTQPTIVNTLNRIKSQIREIYKDGYARIINEPPKKN